ncbi:MAG: hypothetical protein WAU01_17260, partial [Saprospiraceae bacterium]
YRLQLNVLDTINLFATPSDVDVVLAELSLLLLSKPLADNQKTVLKAFLLGGTPTGWTTSYNIYKADPNSETKKATIVNRLRSMIVYMMRMPEYHLI